MVQEFLIALGSNLGCDRLSPLKTIQSSIRELAYGEIRLRRVSRMFVTPCFPKDAGPNYVNACIAVTYPGPANELLTHLHAIEAQFGRVRETRWAGRSLDLDLVAAGQTIAPSEQEFAHWRDLPLSDQMVHAPDRLILPHPRLQDRAFVLVPLCDIAPDWRHPVSGLSVQQMHDALPAGLRAEVTPIASL